MLIQGDSEKPDVVVVSASGYSESPCMRYNKAYRKINSNLSLLVLLHLLLLHLGLYLLLVSRHHLFVKATVTRLIMLVQVFLNVLSEIEYHHLAR